MTETATPAATEPSRPPSRRPSATSSPGSGANPTSGATFESRNPADTRDLDRPVPAGTAADVAMAVRAAERRAGLAADARPEARRDPLPLRRADGGAQGAPRPGDDPGDGQGPRRGPWRRPGRHRHRLPDGRRGPPDVRRHGAVGAARQVGDEHPPADRRRRDHHALELPDRDPVLEDDAGPCRREHGRLQAVERHAALRDARSSS